MGNYTGNTGRDSLRYHNNTAFSTKDKDNDKCVDDCAQFRKGKTHKPLPVPTELLGSVVESRTLPLCMQLVTSEWQIKGEVSSSGKYTYVGNLAVKADLQRARLSITILFK